MPPRRFTAASFNPPYSDDSIHFGAHGPFSDERINFPGSLLRAGQNTLTKHPSCVSPLFFASENSVIC